MQTTADKIAQAQQLFGTNADLANKLAKLMQDQNHKEYSNEFSTAAKGKGIELTAEEVSTHFGFKDNPTIKQQVKETVKDEVKGVAKDEATGRVEDELGNQLGVDLGGVGDAAGGFLDTIKGWFGGGKKKK